MALAENIKEKRLEKSMSQEELSGIVGVTKMAISLYEKGERIPDFYTGLRIARALGTTVEELAEAQATQSAQKQ